MRSPINYSKHRCLSSLPIVLSDTSALCLLIFKKPWWNYEYNFCLLKPTGTYYQHKNLKPDTTSHPTDNDVHRYIHTYIHTQREKHAASFLPCMIYVGKLSKAVRPFLEKLNRNSHHRQVRDQTLRLHPALKAGMPVEQGRMMRKEEIKAMKPLLGKGFAPSSYLS